MHRALMATIGQVGNTEHGTVKLARRLRNLAGLAPAVAARP